MASFWFKPKEDITAYELAIIVKNISFGYFTLNVTPIEVDEKATAWKELPETVKRHFERVKT